MTERTQEAPYDVAIIGGGVNGCGIARDAAGRGLSVFLCEQNDLASATSSASSKLIHGGLRYLEYREFRLVREALAERERLWALAPHIVSPLRFVLPYHSGLRPAWLIRLGLFIYDHLGGRRRLPGTRTIDLRSDPAGAPLRTEYVRGFEYSDCWVDDARLVVLNAVDAAERGASVRTRTRCLAAHRADGVWHLDLEDVDTRERSAVRARGLVNAAGPWVAKVLTGALGDNRPAKIRLIRGSHIVVRRLFDHDRAYILQNADGRIVFAIPYEGAFTMIGTTDVDVGGDPDAAVVSGEEVDYLRRLTADYFQRPIRDEDIVHRFAGIRPLYDDGAGEAKAATRDYVLDVDAPAGEAPLLTVFGGKITTYRRLAEAALDKLAGPLSVAGGPWTGSAPLPGGDFGVDEIEALVIELVTEFPHVDKHHATRLVRAYGTRARTVLTGTTSRADMGPRLGSDLYAVEVAYMMDHEFARTVDDVLWRRSKLGLRLSAAERDRVAAWIGGRTDGAAEMENFSAA